MRFASRLVALPHENVDTDQIIPARFLKTTKKVGLGKVLLYDWRYDAAGNLRTDCVLNQPESCGARVLLAGDNFGCGSSREHAPWALADFGFQVVISTSFADIFCNNCLKNGILPVVVGRETHERLFRLVREEPAAEVIVDLGSQTLQLQNGDMIHFPIDPFAKKCLLEGIDELGYILKHCDLIASYENTSSDVVVVNP
jgi:3-isopropylmalate/(R)-2-methylmalate dehydratase small subunit